MENDFLIRTAKQLFRIGDTVVSALNQTSTYTIEEGSSFIVEDGRNITVLSPSGQRMIFVMWRNTWGTVRKTVETTPKIVADHLDSLQDTVVGVVNVKPKRVRKRKAIPIPVTQEGIELTHGMPYYILRLNTLEVKLAVFSEKFRKNKMEKYSVREDKFGNKKFPTSLAFADPLTLKIFRDVLVNLKLGSKESTVAIQVSSEKEFDSVVKLLNTGSVRPTYQSAVQKLGQNSFAIYLTDSGFYADNVNTAISNGAQLVPFEGFQVILGCLDRMEKVTIEATFISKSKAPVDIKTTIRPNGTVTFPPSKSEMVLHRDTLEKLLAEIKSL